MRWPTWPDPFRAPLLLATENSSRFVKFHAWQAIIGLGALLLLALTFLVLAFAFLVVSATAFWTMLWIAAIMAVTWLVTWALCLFQAYRGRVWRLPLLGRSRRAARVFNQQRAALAARQRRWTRCWWIIPTLPAASVRDMRDVMAAVP